jgi:lipoprotein-anchoring transpeptidase ErfK/SrfK
MNERFIESHKAKPNEGEALKNGNQPKRDALPPSVSKGQKQSGGGKNPKKRNSLLPILLIVMGFAVFAFAAWSAVTSPVLASIINMSVTPPVQRQPFAQQVIIAKPAAIVAQQVAQEIAPTMTVAVMPTATATQESQPEAANTPSTDSLAPTIEAVILPTDTPVPPATAPPEATTSEPGTVLAEIVADTPTPEFTQPTVAPYVAPQGVASSAGEHWIDVNLSQQRVYAYAGDTVVNSFLVSTGTWQTPTVTGQFKIWVKLLSTTMTGPGYYLPGVPYTMYFYKDYGLHGTYWHNNFGTPMSHGCVNLSIPDAKWLYDFSSVGTLVNVHY